MNPLLKNITAGKYDINTAANTLISILSNYADADSLDQSAALLADLRAKQSTYQRKPLDPNSRSNIIKLMQKAFAFIHQKHLSHDCSPLITSKASLTALCEIHPLKRLTEILGRK